jgi:hypothetical protein
MPGKIVPSVKSGGPMYLRETVGTAKDPKSGITYEMLLNADMTPMVESDKTGKRFILLWHELIDMARAAGIDEEDGKDGVVNLHEEGQG